MYRSKLITIVQYTEVIIEICTRGNKTGITLGYATAENHGQWLGKLYNAAHPTTTAMSYPAKICNGAFQIISTAISFEMKFLFIILLNQFNTF